jgi:hypothetical protein
MLSGKKIALTWQVEKRSNCATIPDWTNISASFGFYFATFTN